MHILIYFLVLLSATLLIIVLYQVLFTKKVIVANRMERIRVIGNDYRDDDDLRKPFIDRVVQPLVSKMTNVISNLTPRGLKRKYETLIIQAGVQKRMSPSYLLTMQLVLSVILATLVYGGTALGGEPSLPFTFLVGFLGLILPYYRYSTLARKRQEEIQNSLPGFLDLLYVSVEAGLGFDMAMKRSAEKMHGPLAEEVRAVLDDISKGRNRSDALRSLTKRTGVEDLNTFVTAVIQADQLGSNIANMLRVQSMTARTKRRQRVEQAVAKLPVKMIFPLVFFFIPAIFLVILGPAVLSTIDALGDIL